MTFRIMHHVEYLDLDKDSGNQLITLLRYL